MDRLMSLLVCLGFTVYGSISIANMLSIDRRWDKVPVTIQSVEVKRQQPTGDSSYVVKIRYRYELDGTDYSSDVYSPGRQVGTVESEPEVAKEWANNFSANPPEHCRVNPKDPSKSVLNPFDDFKMQLFLIAMGALIFAVTWGGSIYDAIRNRRAVKSNQSLAPQLWRKLAFPVFFIVGIVAIVTGLYIAEKLEEKKAVDWIETACVIEESALKYNDSEWQPYLLYSWKVDGKSYQSKRIYFSIWHGSVLQVERLLSRYPVDSESRCFYNPEKPSEAVLLKSYGSGIVFPLLLLGTIIVSIFVLIDEFKMWKQEKSIFEYCENDDGHEIDEAKVSQKPVLFAFAGAVLVILMAPAIFREWQLGVWLSISQWLGLICVGAVIFGWWCYRMTVKTD